MAIISKAAKQGNNIDFNLVLFDFIEDMIAQGWRVLGSGDGTSFENDGETSGTTGTGSGGGFHLFTAGSQFIPRDGAEATGTTRWLRLASPSDADHYREYVFRGEDNYNVGTNRDHWRIVLSRTPMDNGASASTPGTPTTGNAIGLCGVRTGTPWPVTLNTETHPGWAGSTDHYFYWWIGDSDENYDFVFVGHEFNIGGTITDQPKSMFGQLRVTFPNPINPSDTDPYVYIAMPGQRVDRVKGDLGKGDSNILNERYDTYTGTSTITGACGAYDFSGGGSLSGTYPMSSATIAYNGTNETQLFDAFDYYYTTDVFKQMVYNPIMWACWDSNYHEFIKGYTTSNILMACTDPSTGRTVEDSSGNRRWHFAGWSFPEAVDSP